MDRDVVGLLQQGLQRVRALDRVGERPRVVHGQERVVADDLHAQGLGRVGHEHADRAQAHDAQGLSLDLRADELALALLHLLGHARFAGLEALGPLHAADDVAGGQEQTGQHELLDRVGVGARRVEHADARGGALVNRDVVVARARARDGEQGARQLHLEHRGRAHDHRVGLRRFLADGEVLLREVVVDHGRNRIQRLNRVHGKIPPSFLSCNAGKIRPSALLVFHLKLLHEGHELFDAFHGHGVVDRGAHAADGPVALEVDKARRGRRLDKGSRPGPRRR